MRKVKKNKSENARWTRRLHFLGSGLMDERDEGTRSHQLTRPVGRPYLSEAIHHRKRQICKSKGQKKQEEIEEC